MNKAIFIALGVLVVLVLIVLFTGGEPEPEPGETLTAGFKSFVEVDLSNVGRFTIEKGDEKAEVEKKGTEWVLASSYGYPADRKKIEKLFEELEKIDDGEVVGWERSSHVDFEVDKKRGARLTFFDKSDNQLASIVLGEEPRSQLLDARESYARFADEDEVYKVEGSARREAGGGGEELDRDYLLFDKLFDISDSRATGEDDDDEAETKPEYEVMVAEIQRPDQNIILERRWVEKPKEESDSGDEDADADGGAIAVEDSDPEEEKKEEEEVEKEEKFYVASGSESFEAVEKSYTVKNYLNYTVSKLSTKAAAEPKALEEYGLDNPQLKVVVKYREKGRDDAELQTLTVCFGNAIKDDKGEDEAYYVMLEGQDDRIFTVEKWTYNNWAKKLEDFKPKPKEEKKDEKKADAATEESPDEKDESGAEDSEEAGATPTAPGASGAEDSTSFAPPLPPETDSGTDESGSGSVSEVTPSAAPPKVSASHILIPYKGSSSADTTVTRSKEEARKEAERILGELRKDPSKFAELAKAHSSCPSSAKGGDLGSFDRSAMVKPFSDAAFALEVGGISDVVETKFGFHVIQRTE